jgi:hypothetical protein
MDLKNVIKLRKGLEVWLLALATSLECDSNIINAFQDHTIPTGQPQWLSNYFFLAVNIFS